MVRPHPTLWVFSFSSAKWGVKTQLLTHVLTLTSKMMRFKIVRLCPFVDGKIALTSTQNDTHCGPNTDLCGFCLCRLSHLITLPRWVLLSSTFYSLGIWGTQCLSNWPKITHLVRTAGLWIWQSDSGTCAFQQFSLWPLGTGSLIAKVVPSRALQASSGKEEQDLAWSTWLWHLYHRNRDTHVAMSMGKWSLYIQQLNGIPE